MNQYYLGIDASKGYSDFVMLNAKKQPVIEKKTSSSMIFSKDTLGFMSYFTALTKLIQRQPYMPPWKVPEDTKTTGFSRCSNSRAAYRSTPPI
jgi:hypothetical protein